MRTTTPLFPTTLEDLQQNPAFIEHWPQISRLVTGYLLTVLFNASVQGKSAQTAEHAAGANYAVAKILEELSKASDKQPPAMKPKIEPLHRFSGEDPGDSTKPNTPEK